jgi:hypothetical protein
MGPGGSQKHWSSGKCEVPNSFKELWQDASLQEDDFGGPSSGADTKANSASTGMGQRNLAV